MANEEQNKKTYIDYYRTKRSLEFMNRYDKDRAWEKLNVCLRRKRLYRRLISVSSVAAVFVAVFTCFYLWVDKNEMSPEVGLADLQETTEKHKSPGVILFLADGQRVDLSGQEKEIPGGNIKNDSENKQLLYSAEQNPEQLIQFNRIEVPRGTDYQLVLSDGSKVWVNARSRLTYPVSFGDVREVTLEGEAYFEVARDEDRPFVVRTENLTVKVLGTEFNLSAYSDQEKITTTLEEGSLKILPDDPSVAPCILSPNEQLVYIPSRGKMDVRQVVASDYSDWKEGGLLFNNDSFEDILKTLERVYNVKVHLRTSAYHSNRLTIHFNKHESLENIMMLVKEMIPGLEYQIKEDGIYID